MQDLVIQRRDIEDLTGDQPVPYVIKEGRLMIDLNNPDGRRKLIGMKGKDPQLSDLGLPYAALRNKIQLAAAVGIISDVGCQKAFQPFHIASPYRLYVVLEQSIGALVADADPGGAAGPEEFCFCPA